MIKEGNKVRTLTQQELSLDTDAYTFNYGVWRQTGKTGGAVLLVSEIGMHGTIAPKSEYHSDTYYKIETDDGEWYEVIKWAVMLDIPQAKTSFTKSDLKQGDQIFYRDSGNKDPRFIFKNSAGTLYIGSEKGVFQLSLAHYDEDLTAKDGTHTSKDFDIINVLQDGTHYNLEAIRKLSKETEEVKPKPKLTKPRTLHSLNATAMINSDNVVLIKTLLEQLCEYSENTLVIGKTHCVEETVDTMLTQCDKLLKPSFDTLDLQYIRFVMGSAILADGTLGIDPQHICDLYVNSADYIDKLASLKALGLSVELADFHNNHLTYDAIKEEYENE